MTDEVSIDDRQLLRRFTEHYSQEAFAALTARYLNLVYSVCRRELDDAEAAEDVTQAVFLILARKAPTLGRNVVLSGWLFQTARFAAKNARLQAQRRAAYEQKAAEAMQQQSEKREDAVWSEIEPLLNRSLAALRDGERECVLLRFFQGLSFAEAGAALGLSEEAARKRVVRALEKMRGFFGKEGVIVPVGVLAVLLPVHAVKAAPTSLASVFAHTTIGAAGQVNAGLMASKAHDLSEGVLRAMYIAKMKVMVAVAVVAAGLASVLPLAAHTHRAHPVNTAIASNSASATALDRAVANRTVLAIMREGLRYEASIRSGRVTLERVTEDLPLDEAQLRKSIKDPRVLAAIMDHQTQGPRRVTDEMQITFDNSRQELLYQGTSSYLMGVRKTLITPKYIKKYVKEHGTGGTGIEMRSTFMEKPDAWPNFSYKTWTGGDWQGWATAVANGKIKPRLLKNDPKTGQACLLFVGPPNGYDQTIWVDRRRGCLFTRLAATPKRGGQVAEEHVTSYERTPQGLWYPVRFVLNFYSYLGGMRHLYRRETTTAKAVELNVVVSDRDFDFGAIPLNSFVQDDRFDPPLTYIQKEKQFTDQELQDMAKIRPAVSPIAVPQATLLANGSTAPDFTVADKDGHPVKLSDYRGKIVVLDFWATWCGPCQVALPHIAAIAKKYQDKDVVVLAVNVWDKQDEFAKWLPTHPQYAPIHFAIDTTPDPQDVGRRLYHVPGIPATYVIDRQGLVAASFLDTPPDAQFEDALRRAWVK